MSSRNLAVRAEPAGIGTASARDPLAREVKLLSPVAIYRHFPDRKALLLEVARMAGADLSRRLLVEVARVEDTDPRRRAIERFLAIGRGYLAFAHEEPNLLAAAFISDRAARRRDGRGSKPVASPRRGIG